MLRKSMVVLSVVVLALVLVIPVAAAPGAPNFEAGLWGDGERWGTKVTTPLPAPDGAADSFDGFFFITAPDWEPADGPGGWLQAPVMQAAPGNPDYHGGRWVTLRVTVTDPNTPELHSYADILAAEAAGQLTVATTPSPDGAHPWRYFQCPMLPLK